MPSIIQRVLFCKTCNYRAPVTLNVDKSSALTCHLLSPQGLLVPKCCCLSATSPLLNLKTVTKKIPEKKDHLLKKKKSFL